MNASIAAVIPLYNGSQFIEEAIRSVVAQTVPVDEIVVVDDGSKDDGPEIVEGLSRLHPITLLRKPNGGQSSARNFAINHTRCSHVAFLDQDDVWYEDHIERFESPFRRGKDQETWPSSMETSIKSIATWPHDRVLLCSIPVPTPQPKTIAPTMPGTRSCSCCPSASAQFQTQRSSAVGFFDESLIGLRRRRPVHSHVLCGLPLRVPE